MVTDSDSSKVVQNSPQVKENEEMNKNDNIWETIFMKIFKK